MMTERKQWTCLHGFSLLLCVSSLAIAYHAIYVQGILPCSLCTLQRWALIGIAAILLPTTWLSHQRHWHHPLRWTCLILELLMATSGTALAARQLWLQAHPDQGTRCLPSLEQMLSHMPWTQAMNLTWQGSADCGEIAWRLSGINAALLALLAFALLWLLAATDIIASIRRCQA